MRNDGKSLEQLVRDVEAACVAEGFVVAVNSKEYLDNGKQRAEFDVEITGKVGTNKNYRGFIQCRDRPSEGPQGAGWIRELVTLRAEFGASHVAAVSTTGFSEPAQRLANQFGIDLRAVEDIDPNVVLSWIEGPPASMKLVVREKGATVIQLFIDEKLPAETVQAFDKVLSATTPMDPILRSITTGLSIAPVSAVNDAVTEEVIDRINPGEEFMEVPFQFIFTADDYYVVDTEVGPVKIARIDAVVRLRDRVEVSPLVALKRYTRGEGAEVIAERAVYSFKLGEETFDIGMQMVQDVGASIVVRKG